MDNEVDITSIYHNSFQKDQKTCLNDEITKFEDFDEFDIPKESEQTNAANYIQSNLMSEFSSVNKLQEI